MAQAPLKSSQAKISPTKRPPHSSSTSSHRVAKPQAKKGGRAIAPKKTTLVRARTMTRKLSAGLTAKTEQMLGARAGHLELLGQGRKKGVEANKIKKLKKMMVKKKTK